MAPEGSLSASLAAVVEDVLKQHGKRPCDVDFVASRMSQEAGARRYEAAGWLRKVVGVVMAKDLPNEPSEEEFRLGLRNGLILCTALNKFHPGAVPKVVVNPGDPELHPDGAALSAYQYFENVRNFLVAVQELGIPTFEASDLEQGGKSARTVNCVLALKSYCEWKQMGGHGNWKYGGNPKQSSCGKSFIRNNSEKFNSSLSRTQSLNENDTPDVEHNSHGDTFSVSTEMTSSRPLNMLVQSIIKDKRPEEVPQLVGSLLHKVMEEFERRIASQNETVKPGLKSISATSNSFVKSKVSTGAPPVYQNMKSCGENDMKISKKDHYVKKNAEEEKAFKEKILRQNVILEQQQRDIRELKYNLRMTKAGMEFIQREYNEGINKIGEHLHSLAHAASGYHKVLEENRKLYNQVQDLNGSIRVYCRVRPFLPGQLSSNTIGYIDDGNINIITSSKHGKEGCRSFNFNKVFGPSATQEEVFSDTRPLIQSVLDGYNVCIFAYGQTGSGKTYTMSGPKNLNEQTQGVNYRALSDLFEISEKRKGTFCYEIAVQMIEIYNEQVRDLLVSNGSNKRLEIRSSSQRGLNVPNANLVHVTSTSDVLELMNIGQKNRAIGATALNDRSSRSHSCLTVHIQGRDNTSGAILRGCMHLVDLAGSERVDKSEVTGERLKEAQHINKSLSALGDVISALAQKNSHVPYRNSKLTQLLQDSLGGQAKTLMFVHISPEMDAIGETLSTLKFAERVSTVELGAARINKENGELKELKEQITRLKASLAQKDGISNHLQIMTPPDTININDSQSVLATCKSVGDLSCSQSTNRHPMEDVGNIEARVNPSLKQKKPSFDFQEFMMTSDSPLWPESSPIMNLQTREDRETISGDWVDKLMVNKVESNTTDDISMGDWEGDGSALPELFYQSYMSISRDYANEPCHRNGARGKESHEFETPRNRFYSTATDESDDLDIATSDSSETDLQWRFNLKNAQGTVDHIGSRIKKSQMNPMKSPNMRTPHHAHIPSPSKKMSNGSNRSGKQLNSGGGAGKRTSSGGKIGNTN